MEKSIENIWNEGFAPDKKFSLPVIKNLYTRKSELLIEKIWSTAKKDNISIIPIAILLFSVLAYFDKILLGGYVAFLLIILFLFNRKNLKELEGLDVTSNTYNYLVNYYTQLKRLQGFYTKLLAIGLPLLVIPCYWIFFRETPIMSDFKSLDLSIQVMILAVISLILSGLGVMSYRLSTHFLYAKLITGLESIISDMEELMKK